MVTEDDYLSDRSLLDWCLAPSGEPPRAVAALQMYPDDHYRALLLYGDVTHLEQLRALHDPPCLSATCLTYALRDAAKCAWVLPYVERCNVRNERYLKRVLYAWRERGVPEGLKLLARLLLKTVKNDLYFFKTVQTCWPELTCAAAHTACPGRTTAPRRPAASPS